MTKLKAGAEMDALVADMVFRWHVAQIEDSEDCRCTIAYYLDPSANVTFPVEDWQPSRFIVQAWQVVEKMREEGWWVSVTQDNAGIWDVALWKGDPLAAIYGSSHENSAPHAICLAALRAVGAIK